MKKEFDASQLLLEKNEKQMYCYCLTYEMVVLFLTDQCHLSII